MSDITKALENLRTVAGRYHEQRVTNLLDAQRAALSAPLTTDEAPGCYCPDDCEMGDGDTVCPSLASVYTDLLPVLLKRIGVTP